MIPNSTLPFVLFDASIPSCLPCVKAAPTPPADQGQLSCQDGDSISCLLVHGQEESNDSLGLWFNGNFLCPLQRVLSPLATRAPA